MESISRLRVGLLVAVTFAMVSPVAAQEAPAPVSPRTGLLHEPRLISTGVDFAAKYLGESSGEKKGWYPVFRGVVAGSGWISAGAGHRASLFKHQLVIDGSASISWRLYKNAQLKVEAPAIRGTRWTIGGQVVWQDLTQLQYFGRSPDAVVQDRSDYRLTTVDTFSYVRYRPLRWFAVEGGAGVLAPPRIRSSAGTFDPDYPDAQITFASEPGLDGSAQPRFLHAELSATADTRDYPGYPTRGRLVRAAWSTYSDRTKSSASFDRYDFEGLQIVPLFHDRLTVVGHGAVTITESADDQRVPAYLLPALGGSSSIRSYDEYRFHDLNLLRVTAEARIPVFRHIDVALFADAGSVAPRAGDLGLSRTAYGFGIRVHTHQSTIARVDVARGEEGWRVMFKATDFLRLRRLARRGAAIPYVP